jgi:DNA polymerase-1
MQLVGPKVIMLDTMKNRVFREAEVEQRFGVGPDKVIEVQALAGDSVDNVPGVPGIGVKTGAQLINEYGDLDTLLERAHEIKQQKRRENLIEFADQARVSRDLVRLEQNVPVEHQLDEFAVTTPDAQTLIGFLKALEFTTLTNRVAKDLEADPEAIEPGGLEIPKEHRGPDLDPGTSSPPVPAAVPAVQDVAIDPDAYETLDTIEALEAWIADAIDKGIVAVDTETTSLDAAQAELVGVSLATAPGRACYIPLAHGAGDGLALDGPAAKQIPLKQALDALKPLLEDAAVLKIAQNVKYDWAILKRYGLEIKPFDDTMLLSYALDSGRGGHGMDELSQRHLDHKPIPFKEVVGSGKSMVTFDKVPVPEATRYAAEDADVTLRLYHVLKPRLAAEGRVTVYERLERPLAPVLAQMELAGIMVDRAVLARLSGDFAQALGGLEDEIHKLAGESFNIASPKQLGEILFDKMSLEGGKKTKTGAWGTGADVLEALAAEGHDLPARVLDWRQLAKLKSTYTDSLPDYINPETGRVHTSYAMASTTTGRLSSSDPNLQNIPVRTAEGRKIRTAFIADKGMKLISADYSQIELRVLAHIADIASLKQAFADGLDIHAMTASEMFGVPIRDMDPTVRRRAKAINFGIIYGISAFGLANQLSIPRGEARDYIETYFERFPGIKDYMEETKAFCRKEGYVKTIFGRICHMPEINSNNPAHRGFVERAAINAPIQGSAADIIRRAMIRMPDALNKARLDAVMLLQVHDELIFEAPEDQVDSTIETARQVMETACEPAIKMSVPLKVDARAADNWDEAH